MSLSSNSISSSGSFFLPVIILKYAHKYKYVFTTSAALVCCSKVQGEDARRMPISLRTSARYRAEEMVCNKVYIQ